MIARYTAHRTWRNLASLLAAFFLLPASLLNAQAATPDLRTYEGWVREAFAAAQRNDRAGLDQVAPRLIETRAVNVGNGMTVSVDNHWLSTALAANEPDLEQIEARLGALLDVLDQPESAAPADAQQRLQNILSRPPFADEPQRGDLLGAVLDWIWRLLDRLLAPLGQVGEGPRNVLGWLIAIVGGLLVAGVLAYWLLGLRRSLSSEARADDDGDPEAGLTAATALQQATALAQGGDYRTAVRYLYLSSLLWLDEHNLLRYDRALTNREYLERLRDNAELRAQLLPIVETFDQVWYGYATLDAEGFARYRRQVEALRRVRM